jgi:TonB family protein
METPGLFHGHLKGTVTLEILIDREGQVRCAEVMDGHPLAYSSAIEALKKWRFTPYEVSGMAVPVLGKLKFEFEFYRPRTSAPQ